jgi:DNA-binding LacI/PurR family transcriptional regulator
MVARRVDALVVCSTGQNEVLLKEIAESGIPVILYDRRPQNSILPTVFVNKKKGMYLALDHLMAAGHRRIMLVSGPRSLMSNYDRYMGLQQYLFEHNLDPADFPAFFGQFSVDYGMEIAQRLLNMENRQTAVITGSVAITAGIMMYIKKHGLTIPNDLALVSSGTFPYPSIIEPRLTYISDSNHEIAAGVLELLQMLIDGKDLQPGTQIEIEPILQVGSSSC